MYPIESVKGQRVTAGVYAGRAMRLGISLLWDAGYVLVFLIQRHQE